MEWGCKVLLICYVFILKGSNAGYLHINCEDVSPSSRRPDLRPYFSLKSQGAEALRYNCYVHCK